MTDRQLVGTVDETAPSVAYPGFHLPLFYCEIAIIKVCLEAGNSFQMRDERVVQSKRLSVL